MIFLIFLVYTDFASLTDGQFNWNIKFLFTNDPAKFKAAKELCKLIQIFQEEDYGNLECPPLNVIKAAIKAPIPAVPPAAPGGGGDAGGGDGGGGADKKTKQQAIVQACLFGVKPAEEKDSKAGSAAKATAPGGPLACKDNQKKVGQGVKISCIPKNSGPYCGGGYYCDKDYFCKGSGKDSQCAKVGVTPQPPEKKAIETGNKLLDALMDNQKPLFASTDGWMVNTFPLFPDKMTEKFSTEDGGISFVGTESHVVASWEDHRLKDFYLIMVPNVEYRNPVAAGAGGNGDLIFTVRDFFYTKIVEDYKYAPPIEVPKTISVAGVTSHDLAHTHEYKVDVDGNGSAIASIGCDPTVNNAKAKGCHTHEIINGEVQLANSVCYPKCKTLYKYDGVPPHTHQLLVASKAKSKETAQGTITIEPAEETITVDPNYIVLTKDQISTIGLLPIKTWAAEHKAMYSEGNLNIATAMGDMSADLANSSKGMSQAATFAANVKTAEQSWITEPWLTYHYNSMKPLGAAATKASGALFKSALHERGLNINGYYVVDWEVIYKQLLFGVPLNWDTIAPVLDEFKKAYTTTAVGMTVDNTNIYRVYPNGKRIKLDPSSLWHVANIDNRALYRFVDVADTDDYKYEIEIEFESILFPLLKMILKGPAQGQVGGGKLLITKSCEDLKKDAEELYASVFPSSMVPVPKQQPGTSAGQGVLNSKSMVKQYHPSSIINDFTGDFTLEFLQGNPYDKDGKLVGSKGTPWDQANSRLQQATYGLENLFKIFEWGSDKKISELLGFLYGGGQLTDPQQIAYLYENVNSFSEAIQKLIKELGYNVSLQSQGGGVKKAKKQADKILKLTKSFSKAVVPQADVFYDFLWASNAAAEQTGDDAYSPTGPYSKIAASQLSKRFNSEISALQLDAIDAGAGIDALELKDIVPFMTVQSFIMEKQSATTCHGRPSRCCRRAHGSSKCSGDVNESVFGKTFSATRRCQIGIWRSGIISHLWDRY